MPQAEEASDMLRLAQDEGGRWMAVSLLYFAASVALVIGLPGHPHALRPDAASAPG